MRAGRVPQATTSHALVENGKRRPGRLGSPCTVGVKPTQYVDTGKACTIGWAGNHGGLYGRGAIQRMMAHYASHATGGIAP